MAYVMRYGWAIKWMPAGEGLGLSANQQSQGQFGGGNAQKLTFFDAGGIGSQTFTATDISNFITAMQNDMTTQMTSQSTRITNWGANTFPATG